MKLTLWTIQHEDAYKDFLKKGILRANEEYLFCGNDLRFAYNWISKKLVEKIGNAPEGVRYPIWAWYQWEGKKARRDLRFSGYAARGTPMVQIEFRVDDEKVMLSDFDDWHLVLSNTYIADSEKDFDEFYELKHKNEKELIEDSWEKIFDIQKDSLEWSTPSERKTIQATLWEVHLEQVKKVEHFIAKLRRQVILEGN